jgi:hypothetical protein
MPPPTVGSECDMTEAELLAMIKGMSAARSIERCAHMETAAPSQIPMWDCAERHEKNQYWYARAPRSKV